MSNRSVLLLAILVSTAGRAQDAGPLDDPRAPVAATPNAEEWNNARSLIEEARDYAKEAAASTKEEDNKCSAKLGAKLEVISGNLEQLSSKFDRMLIRKTYALAEDARALVASDCPRSFARSVDKKLERIVTRLQRADAQIR